MILNEFGEKNNIKVEESELQSEVQKQLKMMPGQEKMVMEFYQKNPSALASLRGTIYEEKIINLFKSKAKASSKEITKVEAEKILKASHDHDHDHVKSEKTDTSKLKKTKNPKSEGLKQKKIKKVSKK